MGRTGRINAAPERQHQTTISDRTIVVEVRGKSGMLVDCCFLCFLICISHLNFVVDLVATRVATRPFEWDGSHFFDTRRACTTGSFKKSFRGLFLQGQWSSHDQRNSWPGKSFTIVVDCRLVPCSHELFGGPIWAILLFVVVYSVET